MELLELIGERILGKIAWAHAQNRPKILAAKNHRLELQAKAKKVQEKYPTLKKSHRATAEKIVELHGGNINTIRKALAKKIAGITIGAANASRLGWARCNYYQRDNPKP